LRPPLRQARRADRRPACGLVPPPRRADLRLPRAPATGAGAPRDAAARVLAHLRDAEAAWSAGDVPAAVEHDRAALRLAREPLLEGDLPAALAGVASELDANLTRAAARTTTEERELVAVG